MPEGELPEDLRRALEAMRQRTPSEMHAVLEESFSNLAEIQPRWRPQPPKSRLEMSKILTQHAGVHFTSIREGLQSSSEGQAPTDEPDVLYKHLFEDLESALDYLALELVERFGTTPTDEAGRRLVMFPVRSPDESDDVFNQKMDRTLPGVRQAHPDLSAWIGLVAGQPYLEKPWLWRISKTVNVLKHRGFPTRRTGVSYDRNRMRRVGNTWVAVQPAGFWDAVEDLGENSPVFNLSEFALASIEFVKGVIRDFESRVAADNRQS